jgi:hypothetical protein
MPRLATPAMLDITDGSVGVLCGRVRAGDVGWAALGFDAQRRLVGDAHAPAGQDSYDAGGTRWQPLKVGGDGDAWRAMIEAMRAAGPAFGLFWAAQVGLAPRTCFRSHTLCHRSMAVFPSGLIALGPRRRAPAGRTRCCWRWPPAPTRGWRRTCRAR